MNSMFFVFLLTAVSFSWMFCPTNSQKPKNIYFIILWQEKKHNSSLGWHDPAWPDWCGESHFIQSSVSRWRMQHLGCSQHFSASQPQHLWHSMMSNNTFMEHRCDDGELKEKWCLTYYHLYASPELRALYQNNSNCGCDVTLCEHSMFAAQPHTHPLSTD